MGPEQRGCVVQPWLLANWEREEPVDEAKPFKIHFNKTQLRPTLKRIDAYVIRWARRKFKPMRHQTKGAGVWFDRLRRAKPRLFAHWFLCHGNGRTSGAV